MSMSREVRDSCNPPDNFQGRKENRGAQTQMSPARNDAGWRFPMANREVKGHRRRNDGEIEYDQRQCGQRQGDVIIENAMVLEIFDFALALSDFQAGGA